MPTPNADETKGDFMSRCIPLVVEEGKDADEAKAICINKWDDSQVQQLSLYGEALHGVEIFRVGKWNGDKYELSDLQEMVANFGKVGFDVPVKIGHTDKTDEPAYGWVESVALIGDRIIANLRDIPKQVYDFIKERRFDAVSAEIFWNLNRNGEKFRRVLKAVSLLGAEPPAVAGLKPLRDTIRGFTEDELKAVHAYTFTQETHMTDKTELKALAKSLGLAEDATQDQIDAKVKELKDEAGKVATLTAELEKAKGKPDNGVEVKELTEQVTALEARLKETETRERKASIDRKVEAIKVPSLRDSFRSIYELALSENAPKTVTFAFKNKDGKAESRQDEPVKIIDDLVERMNKHVAKLFNELGETNGDRPSDVPADNPGAEIDRLVKAEMAKNKLTYSQAHKAVLSAPENAELKQAYAQRG